MLRKGILWPLVLAHWPINFISFIGPSGFTYPFPWNVLNTLALIVIFTAYGLFMLLQKNQVQVMQSQVGSV